MTPMMRCLMRCRGLKPLSLSICLCMLHLFLKSHVTTVTIRFPKLYVMPRLNFGNGQSYSCKIEEALASNTLPSEKNLLVSNKENYEKVKIWKILNEASRDIWFLQKEIYFSDKSMTSGKWVILINCPWCSRRRNHLSEDSE